mmetsp:Transcript_16348/g.46954  ORF Transcript_16348/g.46954 Transcript_16348/m.46954 type:complete len:218 (+) Transcript_16348:278-931(+)
MLLQRKDHFGFADLRELRNNRCSDCRRIDVHLRLHVHVHPHLHLCLHTHLNVHLGISLSLSFSLLLVPVLVHLDLGLDGLDVAAEGPGDPHDGLRKSFLPERKIVGPDGLEAPGIVRAQLDHGGPHLVRVEVAGGELVEPPVHRAAEEVPKAARILFVEVGRAGRTDVQMLLDAVLALRGLVGLVAAQGVHPGDGDVGNLGAGDRKEVLAESVEDSI